MKKSRNRPELTPQQVEAINRQFVDEKEKYHLVYRCQDCVHVRLSTLECTLGYPNEVLALGPERALDEQGEFVFCKDFEINDG